VVGKVVREQFLDDLELALALNFLRVASDDGFGRPRY
jgi:hypothetical protein